MSVEYQSHFIVIACHVAEQVKKGNCKFFACHNYFGPGYFIFSVFIRASPCPSHSCFRIVYTVPESLSYIAYLQILIRWR